MVPCRRQLHLPSTRTVPSRLENISRGTFTVPSPRGNLPLPSRPVDETCPYRPVPSTMPAPAVPLCRPNPPPPFRPVVETCPYRPFPPSKPVPAVPPRSSLPSLHRQHTYRQYDQQLVIIRTFAVRDARRRAVHACDGRPSK